MEYTKKEALEYTKKEALEFIDAIISAAWGEESTLPIKKDPALARDLETLRYDMEKLYPDD